MIGKLLSSVAVFVAISLPFPLGAAEEVIAFWGVKEQDYFLRLGLSFGIEAGSHDLKQGLPQRYVPFVVVDKVERQERARLRRSLWQITRTDPGCPIFVLENRHDTKADRQFKRLLHAISAHVFKTSASAGGIFQFYYLNGLGRDIRRELHLYRPGLGAKVFYPDLPEKPEIIILFFGGGWVSGDIDSIEQDAIDFSRRGYVVVTPDYSVQSRQGTPPTQSLADSRSAIRWVKQKFQRDVYIGGLSSGGHLAIASVFSGMSRFNNPEDHLEVDTTPAGIFAFSPVLDTGPEGSVFDRIGAENLQDFSPLHWIRGAGPDEVSRIRDMRLKVLIIGGKTDTVAKIESLREFTSLVNQVSPGACVLVEEPRGHEVSYFRLPYHDAIQSFFSDSN
jgi:acetyl esterase/lipase